MPSFVWLVLLDNVQKMADSKKDQRGKILIFKGILDNFY